MAEYRKPEPTFVVQRRIPVDGYRPPRTVLGCLRAEAQVDLLGHHRQRRCICAAFADDGTDVVEIIGASIMSIPTTDTAPTILLDPEPPPNSLCDQ